MKILIISNFSTRIESDRFVYIGEILSRRGHQVTLLTSDFNHDQKEHIQNVENCQLYKTSIILLHEPGYPKNVSVKRLWSHYVWGRNVKKYLKSIEKPDVVYCAMPSLTAAKYASSYCRKNKVKFVVDLQDLWPEAFAMAIKIEALQKFFLPMKWMADKSYASADLAVAVSETYVNRILKVNKRINSGMAVYLGNDGEEFEKGKEKYHLERSKDEIVIGYIGNMSTSYDMPCVFDALAKVKERGHVTFPIRFVLIGGGVDEDLFKNYAAKVYANTNFLGSKTYQEMAGMLCDCNIVVNPIVKGSVASIINKVGDYALAGLPVINTQESQEYRQLVTNYNCGINCECGNSDEVADAIEKLALNVDLREQMGRNSSKLGKEKFDRRNTYLRIIESLESLEFQ